MDYIDKEKAIQEILELFEHQLNLLTRKDKLEKMDIRRRIRDVIQPTIRMDIRHSEIYMEIFEDKLNDVFNLFFDEIEFKKKLASKIDETLAIK